MVLTKCIWGGGCVKKVQKTVGSMVFILSHVELVAILTLCSIVHRDKRSDGNTAVGLGFWCKVWLIWVMSVVLTALLLMLSMSLSWM